MGAGRFMENETLAIARNVGLKDGRTIWVPPRGKPFWSHLNPPVDLTADEAVRYLPELCKQSDVGPESA